MAFKFTNKHQPCSKTKLTPLVFFANNFIVTQPFKQLIKFDLFLALSVPN